MDAAKIGGAATSNTNSFEPLSDFVQEDSCDTLLLYLPGFTKEQLRVQLTRSGVLKISGTRPLGDNKWSSFQKDFPVSANCETNKITAKFEDGILYVRQPKLIVPADQKPPSAKTPADEPPATTTKTHHQPDHKPAENNKEAKPTKDEHKVNESSQKDDQIRNNIPEKKMGTSTTRDNDDHKAAAAMSSRDKKREKLSSGKNDTNHQSATMRNDIGKLDDYKTTPAARLKIVRQKMTMVLAVILAFALGMYISNLSWFSKKAEES